MLSKIHLTISLCFIALMFAKAQENISFAGTIINLGMGKNEVVELIDSKYYLITEMNDGLIVDNKNSGEFVGSLIFNNTNLLVTVNKNWGFFEDIKEFYKVLFLLLNESKNASNRYAINLKEWDEPKIQTKSIYLITENREIQVDFDEQNVWVHIMGVYK